MSEFGWIDYCTSAALLVISTLIGVISSKFQEDSAMHFFTVGGKMHSVPVALSMLASFLSSITLIGLPAEVYMYGPQIWLFGPAFLLVLPAVGYYMVPFFREKKYYSAFQYFGERYNRKLQLVASALFTFQMVIYLAIVLYAPALAMNEMAGLDTMTVVTIMYGICIFYTTIGGMKGVVWTDTFQVIVIFAAMFFILYKGTINIGGINVIWKRNQEFKRTNFFNFRVDMTKRYTVWSSFIGAAFLHISAHGANQVQIQRYLTVSSNREAIRMLWINAAGWILVTCICVYAGLLIFATYCYCDPLLTHIISQPDQLFPLYIKETLNIPGFQGLFLCAVFSAGLSTVSAGVNSLAAIWFAELKNTNWRKNPSDTQSGSVKLLAFGFGILSYLVVFAVPYMGSLVQLAISATSIITGTLFGIFILGMFFPKSNSIGVTLSLLSSVTLLCWVVVGESLSQKRGITVHPSLPRSSMQCKGNNFTIEHKNSEMEEAFILFRISYLWYGMIAVLSTILIGMVASIVIGCFKSEKKMTREKNSDATASDSLLNKNILNSVEVS